MTKLSRRNLAGAVTIVTGLALSASAHAQDAASPGDVGCTTVNGVATGPGCQEGAGAAAEGRVENGMPATEHQREVLRSGDEAAQGHNMQATGTGGGSMPKTEHQEEVLKKTPDAGAGGSAETSP